MLNDHCVMCHMEQGLAFPLRRTATAELAGVRTNVLNVTCRRGRQSDYRNIRQRKQPDIARIAVRDLVGRGTGTECREVFLNVANATPSTEPVRAAVRIGH